MSFNPRRAEQQLIAIYQRAYVSILEAIADAQTRGNVTGFQEAMLADVSGILQELDGASSAWVEQVVPRLYRQGRLDALNAWRRAGLTPPPTQAGFATVHRDAVRLLAENLHDNLQDANRFVGRRVRDMWRRAQLDVIAEKLPAGQTMRQAQRNLRERVAEQGLGAFRDSRGRVWRLDSYAEMAVRSVTAEAQNLGSINQLRGMGRDLVKMTEHFSACPVCAPYEGRIYSISGETEGYPPLSVVPGFADGYSVIHPNCRHRVTSFVPELADNPEAERRKSNEPFTDNRSEAEKRRYENEQREQRMRREVERLTEAVAVMPDGAEKTAARERLRALRRERTALRKELGIA